MNFIISLVVLSSYGIIVSVANTFNFNFENMNKFGAGRKMIPDFRSLNPLAKYGYERPEPQATPKPPMREFGPFSNIYQGRRWPGNDSRIYNKSFDYKAKHTGHLYHCDVSFDCVISHIAVETEGAIPILFRGGVGRKFMHIVVKAKSGNPLKGKIRAWCKNSELSPGEGERRTNDLTSGDVSSDQ